jgi:hypothetical protein
VVDEVAGAQVAGFASFGHDFLRRLYVISQAQRRGIVRSLLNTVKGRRPYGFTPWTQQAKRCRAPSTSARAWLCSQAM